MIESSRRAGPSTSPRTVRDTVVDATTTIGMLGVWCGGGVMLFACWLLAGFERDGINGLPDSAPRVWYQTVVAAAAGISIALPTYAGAHTLRLPRLAVWIATVTAAVGGFALVAFVDVHP